MQVAGIVLADTAEGEQLALDRRLAAAPDPLMRGRTLRAADALHLGPGVSEWIFVEARASRYDASNFGTARFAGPPRFGDGIFDASRFAETPPAAVTPIYAAPPPAASEPTEVTLSWSPALPGSARIVLPQDLPRRYGARFDEDRFALPEDAPLHLDGVVFEPPGDADFITTRIAADATASCLLIATEIAAVPIGFDPVAVPFFTPVNLSGGRPDREAQLFLAAPGLAGFLRLAATAPGRFGNDISVVVCDATPGRYDLIIGFAGARFESARAVVAGPDPTGFTDTLIEPGPRGVRHLKAGGVHIEVTRYGVRERPTASGTNEQERTPQP